MQPVLFRVLLSIALIAVLHLCTTDIQYEGVDGVNDKFGHLITFYVLALLADFSFPASGYRLRKILPLVGYGLLIEIIQYSLPHRSFSLLDLTADTAGLLLYGLSLPLLKHIPLFKWRWAAVH